MNKEQLKVRNALSKMLIGSLLCIDQETTLRNYAFYKHETKSAGGKYVELLKQLESDLYFQLNGVQKSEDDKNEFYEQLMKGVNSLDSMMECVMNLKNESQREYFNKDLTQLLEKYNLISTESE